MINILGIVNPVELVHQGILKESMENPLCPMAEQMVGLLSRYERDGDEKALELAIEMAKDTLTPKKSLGNQIKDFWVRR